MVDIKMNTEIEVKQAGKLEIIFLSGYLILLPLMKLPKPKVDGMFQIIFEKMQYADMWLFLFAVIFLKRIFRWLKDPENKTCRNILMAIIGAWTLSTLFSYHKAVSTADTIGLMMLITLFILLSEIINTRDKFLFFNRVNFYMASFVAIFGIIILIVYSIAPYSSLDKYFVLSYQENALVLFHRITSTLTLPDMMTTYLNVALVSGFIVFFNKKEPKLIILVGIIITAGCLAYARSLCGFFITLSFILYSFKLQKKLEKIIVYGFGFFVFILLTVTIIISTFRIQSIQTNEPGLIQVQYIYEDFPYLIDTAIRIFNAHPFIGVGPGSFSFEAKNFIALQPFSENDDHFFIISNSNMDPHNFYMGTLSETGMLGGILMALFFGFLLWRNQKSIYESMTDGKIIKNHKILRAGLVGILISGLFVDILSIRHLWVLLALVYCSATACKNDFENKNQSEIITFEK